MDYKMDDGVVV